MLPCITICRLSYPAPLFSTKCLNSLSTPLIQNQGCHFPDNMKFPDFSVPRLSSTVSPRPFRGLWGHAPQKISKLGYLTRLKINFRQQNSLTFPDVRNSVAHSLTFKANSLTFRGLVQISDFSRLSRSVVPCKIML